MKKAAIFIENWKLPIFKKILESEGYNCVETTAPTDGFTVLRVSAEYLADLVPLVERMNNEAAQFARNQKLH